MNTQETMWITKFLHIYVDKKLKEKYMGIRIKENSSTDYIYQCLEYKDIKDQEILKEMKSIFLSFLKEKELIKDDLSYNPEGIEKIIHLPIYNQCPNITNFIYKQGFGNEGIIENKIQAFRNILSIPAYGLMYIYNNQEEYLFRVSGKDLLFISKIMYDHLDKLVLESYAIKYLNENQRKILSYIFGLRFKAIGAKIHTSFTVISYTKRTEGYLSPDLDRIEIDFIVLKRLEKEMKILQRYHNKYGSEKYHKILKERAVEYLKENAPLWINSDDPFELYISHLILEGLPNSSF